MIGWLRYNLTDIFNSLFLTTKIREVDKGKDVDNQAGRQVDTAGDWLVNIYKLNDHFNSLYLTT